MFEFQKKMEKEYNVTTLDDPNLHEDFVSEAREFLQKVENGELDDDKKKEGDQALVVLFDAKHQPEDSDEVKAQKEENRLLQEKQAQTEKENLIKQAKIDVSETIDLKVLQKLRIDYYDEPEALQVVENKINFITEEKEKSSKQKEKKTKEIGAVSDADKLEQQRKEKVKKEEEEKEAPAKIIIDGLNKLASMKGYYATYEDLRAIGIKPTGDNMEVHGFKLIRQYYFRIYEIIPPKKETKKV